MKDVRVTFSRRHAYATKSNVLKVVKTPGGRLVGAYRSKKRQGPKCGDCGTPLPGIKHLSSFAYKNTHKRERTVSRARTAAAAAPSACGNASCGRSSSRSRRSSSR